MEEGLKEYNFKVSEEAEGERIDKYLNALMDSPVALLSSEAFLGGGG